MSATLTPTMDVDAPVLKRGSPPARSDLIYRILVAASSPAHAIDIELFENIDWDALLHQARHHSLVPLLAHRLLENSFEIAIPTYIRARLRSEFQSNLLRNFGFIEETMRILSACRENGIEVVPYKGPVLAEQLWGSFALRECSDLDFLVRRSDVDRSGGVLSGLGYRAATPVAKSLRPALLRDASEEQFRHATSNILLELQWAPAPRTLGVHYDEEQLWRRLTRISVAGDTVNAPSPEDLVGLLAIHGWKHNWSKLIWIADLAAVMRKYHLDWERIEHSATTYGWRKIFILGLEMVRRVYGIDLTDNSALHPDATILTLAQRLECGLQSARSISYLEWHRDMLAARDSRASQICQLANFIFTPGLAEYSSSKLPTWASPAYRVIRLARVLSLWPEKALA